MVHLRTCHHVQLAIFLLIIRNLRLYAFKRTAGIDTCVEAEPGESSMQYYSIVGCMDATTRCFDLPDNQGQHCEYIYDYDPMATEARRAHRTWLR